MHTPGACSTAPWMPRTWHAVAVEDEVMIEPTKQQGRTLINKGHSRDPGHCDCWRCQDNLHPLSFVKVGLELLRLCTSSEGIFGEWEVWCPVASMQDVIYTPADFIIAEEIGPMDSICWRLNLLLKDAVAQVRSVDLLLMKPCIHFRLPSYEYCSMFAQKHNVFVLGKLCCCG